jgi:aryl-alcohol dehydrogenase-like predicted oxidoreductase
MEEAKMRIVILGSGGLGEYFGGRLAAAGSDVTLARDSHVIPIPGATKPHHARTNLDALDWRLSETEFVAIDRASEKSLG